MKNKKSSPEKKRSSNRERMRQKRQQKKVINQIAWGLAGLAAVALLAYFIWNGTRPLLGETIPLQPAQPHIPDGDPLPAFSSNPPSSGQHYPDTFQAGFYDETSPQAAAANPEGYLVHNLEHGYVVMWYNCSLLSAPDCTSLKASLQAVITAEQALKVIAFPWPAQDVPLALTSWGHLLKLDAFDQKSVEAFITRNRNNAPESSAP